MSVIAIGKLTDESVAISRHGGLLYLGKIRLQPSILDIFKYRSIEKKRFLRNHTDLRAQGCELNLSDILSIDEDGSFAKLIEGGQQVHDG